VAAKEPVLLIVLIETEELRWFVAGVTLDGDSIPLLCSEPADLDAYIGAPFDEQVSFLRHRLSGVLQRGCDRLWGRQMKPCQIVFLADGPFKQAAPELAQRVGEHFVEWMASPPVVFLTTDGSFAPTANPSMNPLAGHLQPSHREALLAGLPQLDAATALTDQWELAPNKGKKKS
jgi:hypothetical protein